MKHFLRVTKITFSLSGIIRLEEGMRYERNSARHFRNLLVQQRKRHFFQLKPGKESTQLGEWREETGGKTIVTRW